MTKLFELPIDTFLSEICNSLEKHDTIIVHAEPGAGKTTRIPPAVHNSIKKKVLVLEPRRLAAKMSAIRVSEENRIKTDTSDSIGGLVGYRMRHESKSSSATEILFITEGMLLALIAQDHKLSEFGCVIIDEFHERNIQTDLAIALVKKLQTSSRPDLKIILMSATMESAPLLSYFPNSRLFEIPGKVFPVELKYLESDREINPLDWAETCLNKQIKETQYEGNILVFLSGTAEINRLKTKLDSSQTFREFEIFSLTANAPKAVQERIFEDSSPSKKRKIVLATNVAETSVTIPGITGVIDLGFEKRSGYGAWSGLSYLDKKKISQASATQRMGRAGRTSPGICYRLYSEGDFRGRPVTTPAEVSRSDLSSAILQILGNSSNSDGHKGSSLKEIIPWFEMPPEDHLKSAANTLLMIGGITSRTTDTESLSLVTISKLGSKLSSLPLQVRNAAVFERCADLKLAWFAPYLCAVLDVGSIARRDRREKTSIDIKDQALYLFAKSVSKSKTGSRISNLSEDLRQFLDIESEMDQNNVSTALKITKQLQKFSSKQENRPPSEIKVSKEDFTEALLAGFPDQIAQRAKSKKKPSGNGPEIEKFKFCRGRDGYVFVPRHELGNLPELIVVTEATENLSGPFKGIRIDSFGELCESTLALQSTEFSIIENIYSWESKLEKVSLVEEARYGKIILSSSPIETQTSGHEELLCQKLKELWPGPIQDSEFLEEFHERCRVLAAITGSDNQFPVFEGELLDCFLAEICEGKNRFDQLRDFSLQDAIDAQVNYNEVQQLEKIVPRIAVLPNGAKIKVIYQKDVSPWAYARMQDCYGMQTNPSIGNGKIPITLHLHAPNKRPLQVTQDIASFWAGSYSEVRGEMKQKYPRHHWPEDPATARPLPPGKFRFPKENK